MNLYLKIFLPFTCLILLASCTVSKKPAASAGGFPGLEESQTTLDEEIVFVEPAPATGNETTIDTTDSPPLLVCEPLEMLPWEIPEAMAGEEFETPIMIRGACGYVACTLADGAPDWLAIDNCTLSGTPTTDESLGDHPITIHIQNTREETEFVDRQFTLSIKDTPKINLFTAPVDTAQAKLTNVYEERDDFEVTLEVDKFYARIEGYADSYDVTLESTELHLESLGDKLYSISPVNGGEVDLSQIEISANDTHENSVSKVFDVHFLPNPCNTRLTIQPHTILKSGSPTVIANGRSINNTNTIQNGSIPIEFGSRYTVVFKVSGGMGPYVWSSSSDVKTEPAVTCVHATPDIPTAFLSEETLPSCSQNVLKKNKWQETVQTDSHWIGPSSATSEESSNKSYFQLSTRFAFPDIDLPYNDARDNTIFDQLSITVTSASCPSNTQAHQATYVLKHTFQEPAESIENIKCTQKIERLDEYAGRTHAILSVNFKKGLNHVAEIDYDLRECLIQGEELCERERGITRVVDQTHQRLDQIDGVSMTIQVPPEWCDDYRNNELSLCDASRYYQPKTLICESDFKQVIFFYNHETLIWGDSLEGETVDWSHTPIFVSSHGAQIWSSKVRPRYPEEETRE